VLVKSCEADDEAARGARHEIGMLSVERARRVAERLAVQLAEIEGLVGRR
jgi:hypothetical protein